MLRRLLFILAVLCAGPALAAEPGPVILVSIDGFRADYLSRHVAPTLERLATEGVRAVAMRPSFPVLTYPNHLAIITGRRPDRHGIVDNVIEDDRRPGVRFTLADRTVLEEPFWWSETEPLWVTAERQGVRTGPHFWPGSEVVIGGVRPSFWRRFDMSVPAEARVDEVLSWLDRPVGERPRFVTLYFDDVDEAGHDFGPGSPQADAAIGRVDRALERLMFGLAARGLDKVSDIVVVSDHGMAATSRDRVVVIEDLAGPSVARMVTQGSTAALRPMPGRERDAEAALLGRHGHVQCWRKADLPARFDYGRNARVQPIVCLSDTGWQFISRQRATAKVFSPGQHGFDPDAPEMQALFVAHGPDFRNDGAVIGPIENVDVHPLLARILGLQAPKGDGSLDRIALALRRGRTP